MSRESLITPPSSIEAEHGVLGSLLLNHESIHRIGDLEVDAFYVPFHGDVFRVIQTMASAGKPFDVISVGAYLHGAS
jgi:replicative DNA helicase